MNFELLQNLNYFFLTLKTKKIDKNYFIRVIFYFL